MGTITSAILIYIGIGIFFSTLLYALCLLDDLARKFRGEQPPHKFGWNYQNGFVIIICVGIALPIVNIMLFFRPFQTAGHIAHHLERLKLI